MDKESLNLIINGVIAIVSMTIGSYFTILSAKYTADREDRRKQAEINKNTAGKRLDKLYEPLRKLLSVTFMNAEDGSHLDKRSWGNIIKIVDENRKYASFDLLDLCDQLSCHLNDTEYFPRNAFDEREHEKHFNKLVSSIYFIFEAEYIRLKQILGYGQILKKSSIFKNLKTKISNKVESWKTSRERKSFLAKKRKSQKSNKR